MGQLCSYIISANCPVTQYVPIIQFYNKRPQGYRLLALTEPRVSPGTLVCWRQWPLEVLWLLSDSTDWLDLFVRSSVTDPRYVSTWADRCQHYNQLSSAARARAVVLNTVAGLNWVLDWLNMRIDYLTQSQDLVLTVQNVPPEATSLLWYVN